MKRWKWIFIIALSIVTLLSGCQGVKKLDDKNMTDDVSIKSKIIFVGNYTKKEGHVDGKADGIEVYKVSENEDLELLFTDQETINPSYLTISVDGRFLYAVNETGPDVGDEAKISAYEIGSSTGSLTLINSQSSHSFAPCYIRVDSENRLVFIVNYVGGTVAIYPLNADGSLEEASQVLIMEGQGPHSRQEASHPHSIVLSPDEQFAFVADLGTDKIMIYKIDYEQGKLEAGSVPFVGLEPASGPRHTVFHPNGSFFYVINELSSTITMFEYNSEYADLRALQTVTTLPFSYSGENSCADIHISEDGNYLYGSNRGHDSIVIYSINHETGSLDLIGHEPTRGEFPRNFLIDGSNLYVANQNSDNIILFGIQDDGTLNFKNEFLVKTPVCLKVYDYRTNEVL
jgi:6-phosphogluconolactonase